MGIIEERLSARAKAIEEARKNLLESAISLNENRKLTAQEKAKLKEELIRLAKQAKRARKKLGIVKAHHEKLARQKESKLKAKRRIR